MGPVAERRMVSLEVAEIAVEVERIAGEQRLLASQVGQSIQTLTTLVHEVQAEQLRAREERHAQTLLLSGLAERASGIPVSMARMQELELKVSHWRGVFIGFGALAALVVAGSVTWITTQFSSAAQERGKLEARIEHLERKP